MKVFYRIGICLFTCLVFMQGCNQSDREQSSSDPYNGLPVIETEVHLDINDYNSTSSGDFYFQSKYFQDMAISKEGNFFVSNRQGRSIQHFDEEGEFIGNIGSEGRGPGEFQISPFFDVQYQDTLFALDRISWMVNIFVNSNGEWVHTNSFDLEKDTDIRPEAIYQLDEKELVIEYVPNPQRLMTENDPSQLKKTIDIISVNGEEVFDSLLTAPTDQKSVYTSKNGGAIIQDLPFGIKSIIDTGPQSSLYHLVTDNFLIEIYDKEGLVKDSIRHSNFSMRISEEERWSAIEEAVTASTGSDKEDQAIKEQMFEEISFSVYPLNNMFVDRDSGNIIVKRSEMFEGPNWLLLNSEGKRLGKFSLSETLKVFDFRNGKIIGALMTEEDDLLPTIRVVSLLQPLI